MLQRVHVAYFVDILGFCCMGDHFHLRAPLPDDGSRAATDEGITAQVFSAFDGFKQERLPLPADFLVSRKRCFEVGQNPAGDRN